MLYSVVLISAVQGHESAMLSLLVAPSCPSLCDPMNPPGSSVHGIPQARILEWAAIPSSMNRLWVYRHSLPLEPAPNPPHWVITEHPAESFPLASYFTCDNVPQCYSLSSSPRRLPTRPVHESLPFLHLRLYSCPAHGSSVPVF